MQVIYIAIRDCGDGSQTLDIVKDPAAIKKMQELADEGDSCYSSGEGLQLTTLRFPDDFDVDAWVVDCFYRYTTLEDFT
jgi:hypothetical protein